MKKLTQEEFIEKAKQVHGDKYDYSKVEYVGSKIKVCIICPTHGEFWQKPNDHLNGHGCIKCSKNEKSNNQEFIEKARKIHGDKYDYSKVEYINDSTKVCIVCPIHGEFWQKPNGHLSGYGCKKCGVLKRMNERRQKTSDFIEKAKQIHGDKYDYSKVEYVNNHTKVRIICPIHGEFLQKPNSHLSMKTGCPKCKSSTLENDVRNKLLKENIKFSEQQTFSWLLNDSYLKLDFYIPKYNIAIECQGIQHFEPVDYFGGEKQFEIQTKNDRIKRKLCEENGIKLLYYSNLHIDYPYKVYENLEEINSVITDEKNK